MNFQYFCGNFGRLIVGCVEERRLTTLYWLRTLLIIVGDNVEVVPLVLVDRVVELLAIDLHGVTFDAVRFHVLIENPNRTEQRPTHVDVHAV